MSSLPLVAVAAKTAWRYSAGETVDDAPGPGRGPARHGPWPPGQPGWSEGACGMPSCRRRGPPCLLKPILALRAAHVTGTVSFGLSRIGSLVAPAPRNVRSVVDALAPPGTAPMVSAEGSEGADLVLDLHGTPTRRGCRWVSPSSRPHRTEADPVRFEDRFADHLRVRSGPESLGAQGARSGAACRTRSPHRLGRPARRRHAVATGPPRPRGQAPAESGRTGPPGARRSRDDHVADRSTSPWQHHRMSRPAAL